MNVNTLFWSVDQYNNEQKCCHVVNCSGKRDRVGSVPLRVILPKCKCAAIGYDIIYECTLGIINKFTNVPFFPAIKPNFPGMATSSSGNTKLE